MRHRFRSFGGGLVLALVLLYLVLVAQFRSFADPLLIRLAIPMGLSGVLPRLVSDESVLRQEAKAKKRETTRSSA